MNRKLLLFALSCTLMLPLTACRVTQTEEGELPEVDVDVEGGKLPAFDVDAPDVDVNIGETEVTVPKVDVDIEKGDVEVPTLDVDITTPDEPGYQDDDPTPPGVDNDPGDGEGRS